MIHDQKTKLDILKKWEAIKKLCQRSHRQAMIPGWGVINETPPEEIFNLPLVLAYAVLDEVLSILHEQGIYEYKTNRTRHPLGEKMEASKNILAWQNYSEIDDGKEKRNDLAHDAKLLNSSECLLYVQAIETELKAWNII